MCCGGGGGVQTSAAAERLYNILGDLSIEQWEGYKQTGRPLMESMQFGVMSPGSVSDYDLRQTYRDRYGVARPKTPATPQATTTTTPIQPAPSKSYWDSHNNVIVPEGYTYFEGLGLVPSDSGIPDNVRTTNPNSAGPSGASGEGDTQYRSKNAPSFAEWKRSLGIGSMLVNPDYEGAAARAGSTVGQAFQAERGNAQRRMASMGVDPRSGAYTAFDNQYGLQEAAAKAGAMNAARRNEKVYADTTNWNRRAAVTGLSTGQAASAVGGLSNAAGGLANMSASQQAADAQTKAGMGSMIGSIGSAAAMAAILT